MTSTLLAHQPVQILLVEDNPGDVRLTQEALKDIKIANTLHVAPDGVVALEMLRQEGQWRDQPRPDLLILDLNLPRKDGRELLQDIKTDSRLKRIPVVVMTTSRAEEDVLKSYDLHANCYISKPVDLEKFALITRSIEDFWFTIVKLPPR